MLTAVNDNIRQRNQAAAGAAAVAGGTEESLAATKAANSAALAEAASQIAVAGENRKDNIETQYLANKANLNANLNNMEVGKAQAISQAVQGVADAASNLFG